MAYTIEQQDDGAWWIFEDGEFFISCSSLQTASEVVEILRKDAGSDG